MATTTKSPKLIALVLAGAASILPATTALGQTGSSPVDTKSFVGGLLDQYAPGVRQQSQIDAALDLADQAKTNSVLLASPPNLATSTNDSAAARERAQRFLNQYAPGTITLGENGVRVATPATIVDTRSGMPDVTFPNRAGTLHRLAILEAEEAFKVGDMARAERWIEVVASERLRDVDVRQLQSLVRLRAGRFDDAADVARDALRVGNAWTMNRLSQLFPTPSDYDSLFNLMQAEAGNPSSNGKAMFLLAYHRLMLGQTDVAKQLLDQAERGLPNGYITPAVRMQFATK